VAGLETFAPYVTLHDAIPLEERLVGERGRKPLIASENERLTGEETLGQEVENVNGSLSDGKRRGSVRSLRSLWRRSHADRMRAALLALRAARGQCINEGDALDVKLVDGNDLRGTRPRVCNLAERLWDLMVGGPTRKVKVLPYRGVEEELAHNSLHLHKRIVADEPRSVVEPDAIHRDCELIVTKKWRRR
jgi:hypothetical protein